MTGSRSRRAAVLVVCLLSAGPAAAVDFAAGPRIGVARSPDALFFGVGFLIGDLGIDALLPLRVEGSADLEFGEDELDGGDHVDFRAWQLNLNLEYPILPPSRTVQVYPLLGVGWYRKDITDCDEIPDVPDMPGVPAAPCRTSGVGLNLGGGVQYRRFAADAYLGIGSTPTLTITGSYLFGL